MLTFPKAPTLQTPICPFHGQDSLTLIHFLFKHLLYLLFSSPTSSFSLLFCLSQGLIAQMRWAVQVVWVKAKGALSLCRPTSQPPSRRKEPSPMTSINWWTTGPEMPWTSHRFTADFLLIVRQQEMLGHRQCCFNNDPPAVEERI